MRKRCKGFPVGISIPSSVQMGACYDQIARYVTHCERTFPIALPAVLISRFRRLAAIIPTFPRLGAAEAASCEGVITECEVRDALKQVGR